jgi:hypothetical protein
MHLYMQNDMSSVPAGTAAQLAQYAELFDIQLVGYR